MPGMQNPLREFEGSAEPLAIGSDPEAGAGTADPDRAAPTAAGDAFEVDGSARGTQCTEPAAGGR